MNKYLLKCNKLFVSGKLNGQSFSTELNFDSRKEIDDYLKEVNDENKYDFIITGFYEILKIVSSSSSKG